MLTHPRDIFKRVWIHSTATEPTLAHWKRVLKRGCSPLFLLELLLG